MFVGDDEYRGHAPGPFIGLDLTENLFVGAVPDFSKISRAAGYTQGFLGESHSSHERLECLLDSLKRIRSFMGCLHCRYWYDDIIYDVIQA